MKFINTILVALLSGVTNTFADVTVSDVKVFSGCPWKEVVVGYTITGTAGKTDVIKLTATDNSANKTYIAWSLTGAVLTEGRHVLRWNAAADGAKFSSANVVFSVSVVPDGVQLWADGPYWAECNVGATKPEECGYYFWWGDTVGYKRDMYNGSWISVKDSTRYSFGGSAPTYGKDDTRLQSDGYINSAGNLVAAHDAATAHLGAPWRMPTGEEFGALFDNCTMAWTKRNGVAGLLVTGKGDYASTSIFLPAAGLGNDSHINDLGSRGYYWSSTSEWRYPYYRAWYLYFYSGYFDWGPGSYRYLGHSVRPVRGFAK